MFKATTLKCKTAQTAALNLCRRQGELALGLILTTGFLCTSLPAEEPPFSPPPATSSGNFPPSLLSTADPAAQNAVAQNTQVQDAETAAVELPEQPDSLLEKSRYFSTAAGQGTAVEKPASKNYFVPPRSTGTTRETEPPRYVRNLSEVELFQDSEADWLDLGLDYRMRYEFRQNDIRRPVALTDEPLLTRTRAYLGVKHRFDPLRFGIEFEDARRTNSYFPKDNRDVNEAEIIQAFGELYFADGMGADRPLRLQYGRLAFEYIDRRLIANNQWRNTTNNFQGFRGILGKQSNDWQLDLLAVQPIERLMVEPDRPDEEVWFYAMIGDWRRWSDVVTLQPYYMILDQDGKGARIDREIHTMGLRGYGNVIDTGFDYDAQFIFQFGNDNGKKKQAYAYTYELGYTWQDHDWKPRASGFIGYASGDKNPNDDVDQRFDKLFGFARPWSANDYITFDNVFAPKTRLEFQPHEKVRLEFGYGAFWLASSTDQWANAQLRDPTGQSGTFMGHEFDLRVRIKAGERTDVTLGYAHFTPGDFPKNTGKPDKTEFFYVELAPRLLK